MNCCRWTRAGVALWAVALGWPLVIQAAEQDQGSHQGHGQHQAASTDEHAGHKHAQEGRVPEAAEKNQAGVAGEQRTCPVSGEPVNKDIALEHDGQKILFCCKDCVGKFEKAPMKYLPALYRQIYPQQVQVKCPVMGDPIDPKVFIEHEGQRVYFCCKGCDKKFKADPAKYLKKMPEVSTDQVRCPVSGKPIDPKHSVEYKGKPVYFCCGGCPAKFEADPDKYADALVPDAGLIARGPSRDKDLLACAVCGPKGGTHARAEMKTTEYKGKRYAFASEQCLATFKKDPAKYATTRPHDAAE